MDRIICHLVQDLLPLYADDVVSTETAQTIRGHLETCDACRKEYDSLTREVVLPANPGVREADSRLLKRFRKTWWHQEILLTLVSVLATLAVTVFGFFALRELIFDSALFNPKQTADLWKVDTEAAWQTVTFEDGEEYMVFDSPFFEKELVLSAMSSEDLEFRITDEAGNVILEPQSLKVGTAVDLSFLEDDVPYVLEIRAQGEYFQLTFR